MATNGGVDMGATRWLKIAPDLMNDAPFFVPVGLICGVLQLVGYRYFDGANLGSTILTEHVALYTLMPLSALVWLMRIAQRRPREKTSAFDRFVNHLSGRVTCLASIAACTLFGFALSVAFFGYLWYAAKFLIFSVYIASLGEAPSNYPLHRASQSRLYLPAWATVVVTPFTF